MSKLLLLLEDVSISFSHKDIKKILHVTFDRNISDLRFS